MRFSWMNRSRTAAPVARGVVALFVVAAAIYAYQSTVPKGEKGGRAATASDPSGQPAARQILSIDPVTGQPRDPSPAELLALQSATVSTPPVPIVSPTTGLTGLSLTDDQMVYSVATRQPDGTVTVKEVDGRNQADQAVQSGAPELLVGKDPRDDK